MRHVLLLVSQLLALAAAAGADGVADMSGAVCWDAQQQALKWSEGKPPAGCVVVARGTYQDLARSASNFGKLRIVANDESVDALLRYRAAGFLEGYASAVRMWHHFNNMKSYFEKQLYPGVDFWGAPMRWLEHQESWVRQQIQDAKASSRAKNPAAGSAQQGTEAGALTTLGAVELLLAQFDGLMEGYAARVAHEHAKLGPQAVQALLQPLERRHHVFMQNNGELYDIVDGWVAGAWNESTLGEPISNVVLRQQRRAVWRQKWEQPRSADAWLRAVAVAERCSAVIKVTGDLSDLLIGHATWDSFTNMLRIYKHYELGHPGYGRVSFSSYPGEVFSDDDFYLSESGLVVLETTNHVFNPSVYESLTPASLLSWQRVRAGLLLASTGEEWVRVFNTHNSGTYNNQYMVVDLNQFKPRTGLAAGLLWVVEQLPGIVEAMDMTDVLSRGYWGSYNVPYFTQIYNMSGYPDVLSRMRRDQESEKDEEAQKHYELPINWLRYQISPRAALFRRDQAAAESLDAFKNLIRYNNYQNDPYSGGAPQAAVCGREDLPPVKHHRRPPTAAAMTDKPGAGHRALLAQRQAHQPDAATANMRVQARMHLERRPKGCYDGKVTSYKLAKSLQSEVVNGPTTSHGLPMFSWDAWGPEFVHMGHPTTFNYTWEHMAAEDVPLPA